MSYDRSATPLDPPACPTYIDRSESWWRVTLRTIAPFLLLVAVWQITAWIVTNVRGVYFPAPLETMERLIQLLAGGYFLDYSFYTHMLDSLARWGTGFVLAALLGIVGGLCLGWFRGLGALLMPILHMMQGIPSLAWIPVAILLLGLGSQATVFIIFLACLWAIAINTVAGVRSVDPMLIRAAEMLGTNRGTLFRRVLLPGSLPHILSGLRVGLANGWRALIAAEMVAGQGTGLGYAIFQARWSFDYESAFASIVVIACIGLLMEALFRQIENRTVKRWGLDREGGG